jgi:3',5'-cyclic-AMP phosphodiesterase
MMKKVLIVITLIIFLFLGGYLFLKFKQSRIIPSQADIGNSAGALALNSFHGVVDQASERPAVQAGDQPSSNISQEPKTANQDGAVSQKNESVFSFSILGDTQRFTSGNPNGNFQKAVAGIQKLNSDMVIAVGDLVSNCKGESNDAQDYANWKNILGPLASKTYAVQGNHDRVENGDKCDQFWQNTFNFPTNGPAGFSELTYSLDLKNSHFVFLDSDRPDGHQVNDTQRTWLESDLAKNKMENTFVFFHEPAFPVSSKIGESLDTQASQRNSLWQIFDKYNVTAVFNGHEHIVSRRKIDSKVFPDAKNSIYQFVFANTNSFNHDLPQPGIAEYSSQIQGSFGLVKVNGKEITVETHGPNGDLLNTFTFSK